MKTRGLATDWHWRARWQAARSRPRSEVKSAARTAPPAPNLPRTLTADRSRTMPLPLRQMRLNFLSFAKNALAQLARRHFEGYTVDEIHLLSCPRLLSARDVRNAAG